MTNHNQKQHGGVNPVVAGVVGAVVGAAAVGIAGVVALANDDSRKQAKKVIDEAKDNVSAMKANVEEKIVEGKEKVNNLSR